MPTDKFFKLGNETPLDVFDEQENTPEPTLTLTDVFGSETWKNSSKEERKTIFKNFSQDNPDGTILGGELLIEAQELGRSEDPISATIANRAIDKVASNLELFANASEKTERDRITGQMLADLETSQSEIVASREEYDEGFRAAMESIRNDRAIVARSRSVRGGSLFSGDGLIPETAVTYVDEDGTELSSDIFNGPVGKIFKDSGKTFTRSLVTYENGEKVITPTSDLNVNLFKSIGFTGGSDVVGVTGAGLGFITGERSFQEATESLDQLESSTLERLQNEAGDAKATQLSIQENRLNRFRELFDQEGDSDQFLKDASLAIAAQEQGKNFFVDSNGFGHILNAKATTLDLDKTLQEIEDSNLPRVVKNKLSKEAKLDEVTTITHLFGLSLQAGNVIDTPDGPVLKSIAGFNFDFNERAPVSNKYTYEEQKKAVLDQRVQEDSTFIEGFSALENGTTRLLRDSPFVIAEVLGSDFAAEWNQVIRKSDEALESIDQLTPEDGIVQDVTTGIAGSAPELLFVLATGGTGGALTRSTTLSAKALQRIQVGSQAFNSFIQEADEVLTARPGDNAGAFNAGLLAFMNTAAITAGFSKIADGKLSGIEAKVAQDSFKQSLAQNLRKNKSEFLSGAKAVGLNFFGEASEGVLETYFNYFLTADYTGSRGIEDVHNEAVISAISDSIFSSAKVKSEFVAGRDLARATNAEIKRQADLKAMGSSQSTPSSQKPMTPTEESQLQKLDDEISSLDNKDELSEEENEKLNDLVKQKEDLINGEESEDLGGSEEESSSSNLQAIESEIEELSLDDNLDEEGNERLSDLIKQRDAITGDTGNFEDGEESIDPSESFFNELPSEDDFPDPQEDLRREQEELRSQASEKGEPTPQRTRPVDPELNPFASITDPTTQNILNAREQQEGDSSDLGQLEEAVPVPSSFVEAEVEVLPPQGDSPILGLPAPIARELPTNNIPSGPVIELGSNEVFTSKVEEDVTPTDLTPTDSNGEAARRLPPVDVEAETSYPQRIEAQNSEKFIGQSPPSLTNARSVDAPTMVETLGERYVPTNTSSTRERDILNFDTGKRRDGVEVGFDGDLSYREVSSDQVIGKYGSQTISKISQTGYGFSTLGSHWAGSIGISSSVSADRVPYVMAHELGHAAHSLLGDRLNKDPEVQQELEGLADVLYPGLKKDVENVAKSAEAGDDFSFYNYLLSSDELIAEFNVLNLTDPERAQAAAPKLKSLLDSAAKDPNLVVKRDAHPSEFGTFQKTRSTFTTSNQDGVKVRRDRRIEPSARRKESIYSAAAGFTLDGDFLSATFRSALRGSSPTVMRKLAHIAINRDGVDPKEILEAIDISWFLKDKDPAEIQDLKNRIEQGTLNESFDDLKKDPKQEYEKFSKTSDNQYKQSLLFMAMSDLRKIAKEWGVPVTRESKDSLVSKILKSESSDALREKVKDEVFDGFISGRIDRYNGYLDDGNLSRSTEFIEGFDSINSVSALQASSQALLEVSKNYNAKQEGEPTPVKPIPDSVTEAAAVGNIEQGSPEAKTVEKIAEAKLREADDPQQKSEALTQYTEAAVVAGTVKESDPKTIVNDPQAEQNSVRVRAENVLNHIRNVKDEIGIGRATRLVNMLKRSKSRADVDAVAKVLMETILDARTDTLEDTPTRPKPTAQKVKERFESAGEGIRVGGVGGFQFIPPRNQHPRGYINIPLITDVVRSAYDAFPDFTNFAKEVLSKLGRSARSSIVDWFKLALSKNGKIDEKDIENTQAETEYATAVDSTRKRIISHLDQTENRLSEQAEEVLDRREIEDADDPADAEFEQAKRDSGLLGHKKIKDTDDIKKPDIVPDIPDRQEIRGSSKVSSTPLAVLSSVKGVFRKFGMDVSEAQIQDSNWRPMKALASFLGFQAYTESALNLMLARLTDKYSDLIEGLNKTEDGNYDLKNFVTSEDPNASYRYSDVVESLQRDPDSYTIIDPLFKEFVEDQTALNNYHIKLAEQSGMPLGDYTSEDGSVVDLSLLNTNAYGPRGMVTHPDIISKERTDPSSKKAVKGTGSTGQRKFKTEQEGIEKGGYIYPDDPITRMLKQHYRFLESYNARMLFSDSDFRSVSVPSKRTVITNETIDPKTGDVKIEKKFVKKALDSGVVRFGPLMMVTDSQDYKELQAVIDGATKEGRLIKFLSNTAVNFGKLPLTSDPSFMFNQGFPLLASNPKAWAKAVGETFIDMFKPKSKSLPKFLESKRDIVEQYVKHVGNLQFTAEDFGGGSVLPESTQRKNIVQRSLEKAGKISRVPKFIEKFNRAQGVFQSTAAILAFEADLLKAKSEGRELSTTDISYIAKMSDDFVGRTNLGRYGVSRDVQNLNRLAVTAMGMYVGMTSVVTDMFSSNENARKFARKRFALMYGATNAAFLGLALAFDSEPTEDEDDEAFLSRLGRLSKRLIPGAKDFWSINFAFEDDNGVIDTKTLTIGGFHRGLFNMLGDVIGIGGLVDGDGLNFEVQKAADFVKGKGRSSLHLIGDLYKQEDYFGNPRTIFEILVGSQTPISFKNQLSAATDPLWMSIQKSTGLEIVTRERIEERNPSLALHTFDFLTNFVGLSGYVPSEGKSFNISLDREGNKAFGKKYDNLSLEEAEEAWENLAARGVKKPSFDKRRLADLIDLNKETLRDEIGGRAYEKLSTEVIEKIAQLPPYNIKLEKGGTSFRIPAEIRKEMRQRFTERVSEMIDSGLRTQDLVTGAEDAIDEIKVDLGMPATKRRR